MEQLNELALFAGAGGGILGGQLLGWKTVCAVEINPYAASVLLQRQNDGLLPLFPVWDDVCTFDGRPWRGIVDVVSGGFPCQDISAAGKGGGITGERSGLWKEFARIVRDVRPSFVFVENSPILTSLGLDVVLGDLAALGYDARWGVFSAASVGAPHLRERIWIVAYSDMHRLQGIDSAPGSASIDEKEWTDIKRMACKILCGGNDSVPESWIIRKNAGMADRVDRTKAIGNGQVPQCAAEAFKVLTSLSGSLPYNN